MTDIPVEIELRSFPCHGRRPCLVSQKSKAVKQKNLSAKRLKSCEMRGFPSGCPEERLYPGRL